MKRWKGWVGKANGSMWKNFVWLLQGSHQWQEMRDESGQQIFAPKKKSNLHRLSLLNSSIMVWNSTCEEYLNNHVFLKKFQPDHSSVCYLWILISLILSSHLPFRSYNGFKLRSCPASKDFSAWDWKPKQVHGCLSHSSGSQPASCFNWQRIKPSFPKPQTYYILLRVK